MRMLISVAELKEKSRKNYADLLARLAAAPLEQTIDALIEKLEKDAIRSLGETKEATSGTAFNCTTELWKGCDGLLAEAKIFDLSLNAIRDDDLIQIVRTILTPRLVPGYTLEVYAQNRSAIMIRLTWKEATTE